MKTCFNHTTVRYLIILLIAVLLTLLLRQAAVAQVTTVSGTVYDVSSRKAISFASVSFTGSDKGIATDEDGNFRLSANGSYNKISISHTGYVTREISVKAGEEQIIDIQLQRSSQQLSEIERNKNIPRPLGEHFPACHCC